MTSSEPFQTEQDTSTPPVCPRHPGTVSYVRCQRCERPVCPQCQVPSAVGIHCVDCVGNRNQQQRGSRGVLGGGTGGGAGVTKVLIGVCVLVYLVQLALPQVTSALSLVPAQCAREPWRLLTTAFLHGSLPHLAFNMWALWFCGSVLEPVQGRWRFLCLYLVSALGGSALIYWLASPSSPATWWGSTVGASGAVFGLFAAMFVVQRRFGRDTSGILGLLVVNLALSFLGANISWQGHLGGLVTGALLSSAYAWAPGRKHTRRAVAATLGLTVLLAVLVVLRVLAA